MTQSRHSAGSSFPTLTLCISLLRLDYDLANWWTNKGTSRYSKIHVFSWFKTWVSLSILSDRISSLSIQSTELYKPPIIGLYKNRRAFLLRHACCQLFHQSCAWIFTSTMHVTDLVRSWNYPCCAQWISFEFLNICCPSAYHLLQAHAVTGNVDESVAICSTDPVFPLVVIAFRHAANFAFLISR